MKAFALLFLVACAPTEQACRALMPLTGDAITITSTPNSTTGFTTTIDGVSVTTETPPRRTDLGDGQPMARREVQRTIAAIKARHDIEARLSAAEAATATTITNAKDAGKKMLGRLTR